MVSTLFFKKFRKLDAFAKTIDDFRVRTATGGTVALISGIIIALLVFIEVIQFLTPELQSQIVVDGGKMEKLPIAFDITFPHLPCYMLSLDVMDESGDHISEYDHDVYKERLDSDGKTIIKEKSKDLSNKAAKVAMNQQEADEDCGSCYGASFKSDDNKSCCNTCEDVQRAYSEQGWSFEPDTFEQCIREGWTEKIAAQSREGCRMHGTLLVNKLRGNFHFSAGRAFNGGGSHIHDLSQFLTNEDGHNFIHTIHSLQFGSHEYNLQKQKRTKSKTLSSPLDNTKWGNSEPTSMYQYFTTIVPTEFDFMNGKQTRTFQYSVSKQDQLINFNSGLPGVFFVLNHSPLRVIYSETRPTFGSFLTNVCAIIGGIFSVASIIDSVLYRAEKISKQRKAMQ